MSDHVVIAESDVTVVQIRRGGAPTVVTITGRQNPYIVPTPPSQVSINGASGAINDFAGTINAA